MTSLLTTNYKLHVAQQLLESINEQSNTAYYIYVAEHVPRNGAITTPDDSVRGTTVDVYRNMIFGKRVAQSDAALMIRNIPYELNKEFAMYDDLDADLISKDFYCFVNEGSYYHCFKCLDNNFNSSSTFEPLITYASSADNFTFRLSDGYLWKYMFSVTETMYDKFATDEYAPVANNTEVSTSATDGSIDVVLIANTGRGYDNHVAGTFSATSVRVGGNNIIYSISDNTAITQVNGFYTDCILYLSTGTGAGQFANITNYYSNGAGSFVMLDSPFLTAPLNGTTYQINPRVNISGSGSESVTAIARALINTTSSNSIYRVEMLVLGEGYDFITANVSSNSVVGVDTIAELRPIYSPVGGHGKDSARELNSSRISFSVRVSNNESNTIVTNNGYQKIGLLRDPIFANVNIELSNTYSSFLFDENVFKIDPLRINTNATINTSSSTISSNTGDFSNQLSTGDYVYIYSSDGSNHQLGVVNSVTNSTVFSITSNGLFNSTDAVVNLANPITNCVVTEAANSTNILVANVIGTFSSNDTIIGFSSGAKSTVNAVSRNDVTKGFNTFIQMYKYKAALVSETFDENEKIYQGTLANQTANATLHSAGIEGGTLVLYTTNQIGSFTTSTNVFGSNSSAIAVINTIYEPELVFGSGDILYVENIEYVERENDQSETFRLIFEF